MGLKKFFIMIFQILAICAVSAGCVYLVRKMFETMWSVHFIYAGIAVVMAGGLCIVASLIKSIIETVQK